MRSLAEYINSPSWNRPAFYDDDDDEYSIQVSEKSPIAIAPVLPTEEPKNSLSMGDEHISTISETESDQVIKSSVEDLVLIPSKSEGILDHMCDVPFSDKNYFDVESDLIESFLIRDTLIVYSPKIDSLLEEERKRKRKRDRGERDGRVEREKEREKNKERGRKIERERGKKGEREKWNKGEKEKERGEREGAKEREGERNRRKER
nr:hypothetical protein [Tanacetum cinerariifolium]